MLRSGITPNETVAVSSGKELVSALAGAVKKYRNIVVVGGVKGRLQNTVDIIAKATGLQLVDVAAEDETLESDTLFRIPVDSDAVSVGGYNCGCRIEKNNQVIIMLTDNETMLKKILPAALKNGFFVSVSSPVAATVRSASQEVAEQGTYDSDREYEYYASEDEEDEYEYEETKAPRLIKPLGKGNDDAINLDDVFGSSESNKYVYQKRGSWLTKLLVTLAILSALAAGLFIFYQKAGAGMISDFVFNRVSTIYKSSLGDEDKFETLKEKNEDFCGWLKISQTDINYPVMLSSDYEDTTFFKFGNRYGTPYLGDSSALGYENRNLTIYGTNLDGERVFAPLESYRELSYYKAHPTISFDTEYGDGTYKIFAVLLLDDSENFDFSKNKFEGNEFYNFINELNTRSLVLTTVEVDTNSELLTLTTTLNDFDGARIAVVAKKVTDNESSDVDTDGAMRNPSAIVPSKFSGTKQYETDASVSNDTTATVTEQTLTTAAVKTTEKISTVTERKTETEKTERIKDTTKGLGDVRRTEPVKTTAQTTATVHTTKATDKPTTVQTTQKPASSENVTQKPTPTQSTSSAPGGDDDDGNDKPTSQKIRFSANGTTYYADRTEVIARIIQAEIGNEAPIEAMKAQAVTAYSYIKARQNGNPNAAVSGMAYSTRALSDKCLEAAKAVDGIAVKYGGRYASLYCFGISAGKTAWSSDVWGGYNYPYTSSVDSSVDAAVSGFHTTKTYKSEELAKLLNEYIDFDIKSVDKDKWVVVTEYDANKLYSKWVCIGGKKTVYGESFRCFAMKYQIRSHAFTVKYDKDSDTFTFDVKGWGHGVGLSQEGAIQYAKQGKNYKWILDHYFNIDSSGAVYVKD